MTARLRLFPLIALTLPAAALAQSADQFQLPPAPAPTTNPDLQGPVATDAPVPIRPRAITTARPTPSPTPTLSLPTPSPSPSSRASGAPPPARVPAPVEPRPMPRVAPSAATPSPLPQPASTAATGRASPTADTAIPPPVTPSATATPASTTDRQGSGPLLWMLLGALVAAIAGTAVWSLLRRRRPAAPPVIEPPRVRAPDGPTMGGPVDALSMTVEAITLNRSFLNATVEYRVTLRNRLSRAITDVAVDADLTSASNDRPVEEQLTTATTALERKHSAARLMPGQSVRLEGKVQLPVAQAAVVRQGPVALLVPLLRIRASAAEALPVVKTLVVGQGAPGAARPQPFRLDDPPRSYSPLVQRALDPRPRAG